MKRNNNAASYTYTNPQAAAQLARDNHQIANPKADPAALDTAYNNAIIQARQANRIAADIVPT